MSNSLNFSLSDDGAHGPVIASPPMGRQPSFVPSQMMSQDSHLDLIRNNLTSEAQRDYLDSLLNTAYWKPFGPVAGRNQNFKLHAQGLTTLQALIDRRKSEGFVLLRDKQFYIAAQTQKANGGSAPRKYGIIERAWVAEQARNGSKQYVNEIFFSDELKDYSFKPAFDIDGPKDTMVQWDLDTELGVARFVIQFVAECASKLGYSDDITDYTFIQTLHSDKWSFHVVVNCNLHYKSNKHMLAHLRESQFDFKKFFVDTHLYATNAQLRIPYSGKWDDKPYAPALIMGVSHEHVTQEDIARGLAQFVPADSRLIEVQLAERNFRGQNRVAPHIQTVMECLKQKFESPDLEASSINEHMGKFECDGLMCPCDHRGATIMMDERTKTIRIQCTSFCPEFELGWTPLSDQYLKQYKFLEFLVQKGFCRLDTPIFKEYRGFGYIQLDPYTFQRLNGIEEPVEWVDFYVNPRKGKLIDDEFFTFIRDKKFRDRFDPTDTQHKWTRELLCGYLDLMIGKVSKTDKFYIRTKDGIQKASNGSIKQDIGACCYEVERKVGRGDDAIYVISEKPFYSVWEKYGNFCRGGISFGPLLKLDSKRFDLPPMKTLDVNDALKDWMELDVRNKLCLQSLWKHYLKMATAYETIADPEKGRLGAEFLQRWTCQVMFDSFNQTKVCPVFISPGGGQGKSTLGNFIASYLGLKLSTTGRTAKDLLLNQFTEGTNNFRLLDEVFLTMEMVEKLKEVITSDFFKAEGKGIDASHEVNRTNHFITSNKEFVLAVNQFGFERRFLVFMFLAIDTMNDLEDGKFFLHRCMCSGRQGFDGDEVPCLEHSFCDHRSFIGLWHTLITRRIDEDGQNASYETGNLFSPFVGMLYSIFLENKVEWMKNPISRSAPELTGTKQAQNKVKGQAAKLIDEWVTQGFVWSPAANPDKINSSWKVMADKIPDFYIERGALSHTWAKYIPKSTVYQLYCEAAVRKGWSKKSEDIYFNELGEVWIEKTGNPLNHMMKKALVETLKYERTGPTCEFINTRAIGVMETCIYFGDDSTYFNRGRPWPADVVGPVPQVAPPPQPQPQEVRAEAPVAAAEPPRKKARPGQSSNYVDPEEGRLRELMRESTRAAAADAAYERELEKERAEQQAALKRAHDAWDAEDAQDGYDADEVNLRVHKKITKSLSLSDCVDEAEQDRIAAAQDEIDEIGDEEGDIIMGQVYEDEIVEEVSSEVVFSSLSQ